MRKILFSLLTIGTLGALAFGGSRAYFSDVETSTGNTFEAGMLDLQIDNTTKYFQNDVMAAGYPQSWPLKDLTGEKFFNFSDVKPGDYGENTISIHVSDNDAWVCMDILPLQNNENGCNDSEDDVDASCATPGEGQGELAQNLNFFAWLDEGQSSGWQGHDSDSQEGDNVFQENENRLFSNIIGPASDVLSGRKYPLADSTHTVVGGPFLATNTYYVGIAWCAGKLTENPGGGNMTGQPNLHCDGSFMGNNTQSDSMTGDINFRTKQYRNNPGFDCNAPDLD